MNNRLLTASEAKLAPQWSIDCWFGTDGPLDLESLRGRVVVLHAFQMLCPGCVSHGLPQAKRVAAAFSTSDVAVVGLHSVFEHHDVMGPQALRAFLHEYAIDFPVGVDRPGTDGPLPQTMARYQMRGTPTLVLIDRAGRLRVQAFGRPDDLWVGAAVGGLLEEGGSRETFDDVASERPQGSGCAEDGCAVEG